MEEDSRLSRFSLSGMTGEGDAFYLAALAWCGRFPTQSFLLLGNDEERDVFCLVVLVGAGGSRLSRVSLLGTTIER